jgi:hypothetical protein
VDELEESPRGFCANALGGEAPLPIEGMKLLGVFSNFVLARLF